MTDPIADMLTRIRNAVSARKGEVKVPYSRIKFVIAQILANEGFVQSVERTRVGASKFEELSIILIKGEKGEKHIRLLKRISTPGRRLYAGYRDIARRQGNQGIMIMSTPKGVMTGKEARRQKLGGEIICEIA